jgi:hypothetical protein
VLIGGLALFGLAGRYAVSHDRHAVHRQYRSWRRVRPARRGVLIINPGSGGGKATRFDLAEAARKRSIEPLLLGPAAALRELAMEAPIGVYAHVVQDHGYRAAKLGTRRRMLPDMLGPEANAIDLQFEGPDARDWAEAALVMVANNPYRLDGFSGAGTRPRLDTGRLGLLATRIQARGTSRSWSR